MSKTRTHNEWFRTVKLGGRKSCPNCKEKLQGESIWSWGQYQCAKWKTVTHFCRNCYASRVKTPLQGHTKDCGCNVQLVPYGGEHLPEWLTI